MWFIQNTNYKNYYQKQITTSIFHFVSDIKEATSFKTKKEATQILNKFNNKNKFEIVKVSKK